MAANRRLTTYLWFRPIIVEAAEAWKQPGSACTGSEFPGAASADAPGMAVTLENTARVGEKTWPLRCLSGLLGLQAENKEERSLSKQQFATPHNMRA